MFTVLQSSPDASLAYSQKYFDQVGRAFMELPDQEFLSSKVIRSPTFSFGGIKAKDWHDQEALDGSTAGHGVHAAHAGGRIPGVPALPPPLPGRASSMSR